MIFSFEKRLEGNEEVNHANSWGRGALGRGSNAGGIREVGEAAAMGVQGKQSKGVDKDREMGWVGGRLCWIL